MEGHKFSFDTLVVALKYIISVQNDKYVLGGKNIMTISLDICFHSGNGYIRYSMKINSKMFELVCPMTEDFQTRHVIVNE